jgi:subtilisin family serine protease
VDYITVNVLRAEDRLRVAERLTGAVAEGATVWGQIEDLGELGDLLSPAVLLRSLRSDNNPPPAFSNRLAQRATAGVRIPRATGRLEDLEPPPALIQATFVVSLLGPLFQQWLQAMEGINARPLAHIGDDTYTVAVSDEDSVGGLPFVSAVRRYDRDDTVRLVQAPESLGDTDPFVTIEVACHTDQAAIPIGDWVAARGGQILLSAQNRFRCLVRREPAIMLALADNQDVALIEEVQPTEPANDHAGMIVGNSAGRTHRGTGQIVAVADTGIDDQHPDIAPRLRGAVDLAGRGTTADTTGHGTHVAASIAGAGMSDPAFTGMAPACEIHFQAITGSNGDLTGGTLLPGILSDAETAGASIVNLSWTEINGFGRYGTGNAIDGFVRDHPAILVVAAAGNQGTEATPPYGTAGYAAKRTVAPPGTAKNCLSIGASRSDVSGISTAIMPQDWQTWFPGNGFRNAPIASDPLSGDAARLDARSGRGPCATDSRIKPDLVAPGTFICSARANVGACGTFWASHHNQHYAYAGGTSMAAAIVSGCAAVVRDWVVNDRGHEPSAALLRALLVNGSARLSGWDAAQDGGEVPSFHQGFGRLDLAGILPDPSRPDFSVRWVDDWQARDRLDLSYAGEAVVVRFSVDSGSEPLRLCLTWDDPEGPAVVNPLELMLTLESLDDPTYPLDTWRSNPHAPGRQRRADESDLWNNVHIIRVEDPSVGWYQARIQANSTLYAAPQGFALAFSGRIRDMDTPSKQS